MLYTKKSSLVIHTKLLAWLSITTLLIYVIRFFMVKITFALNILA